MKSNSIEMDCFLNSPVLVSIRQETSLNCKHQQILKVDHSGILILFKTQNSLNNFFYYQCLAPHNIVFYDPKYLLGL